jgi:crotonobetainyl-CoA:carnitine CoA-transferase CaiB-like acyl-CoA transferase
MADYAAGLVAACGLLAGIVDARRTGRGRDLDTSLFDTALAMLSYQATWWLSAEIETRRLPLSAHPSIVPFQFFATADGYIAIACAKEKFFQSLIQVIGMAELAEDPRFGSFAARHQHRADLTRLLARRLREQTTAEWLDRLRGQVPCAPVRELSDALDVERLERRDMLASYEHPRLGTVRAIGLPLRVSGFTPSYRASPALGADAADLLAELGFDESAIARLTDAGAFGRA